MKNEFDLIKKELNNMRDFANKMEFEIYFLEFIERIIKIIEKVENNKKPKDVKLKKKDFQVMEEVINVIKNTSFPNFNVKKKGSKNGKTKQRGVKNGKK